MPKENSLFWPTTQRFLWEVEMAKQRRIEKEKMANPEHCDICHQIYVHCEKLPEGHKPPVGRNLTIGWQKPTTIFQERPIVECLQRVGIVTKKE